MLVVVGSMTFQLHLMICLKILYYYHKQRSGFSLENYFQRVEKLDQRSSMAEGGTTLEYTPTWVVALVCGVVVIISLAVERFLHYIGKACTRQLIFNFMY